MNVPLKIVLQAGSGEPTTRKKQNIQMTRLGNITGSTPAANKISVASGSKYNLAI
jgi:hypothetical protein